MTDDDRKREQARLRMQRYRQRLREQAPPPPARPCEHCGQPLPQGRYLGDRRRYCSAACRWAAASRRRRTGTDTEGPPPQP
jgi:hypothetical protein